MDFSTLFPRITVSFIIYHQESLANVIVGDTVPKVDSVGVHYLHTSSPIVFEVAKATKFKRVVTNLTIIVRGSLNSYFGMVLKKKKKKHVNIFVNLDFYYLCQDANVGMIFEFLNAHSPSIKSKNLTNILKFLGFQVSQEC